MRALRGFTVPSSKSSPYHPTGNSEVERYNGIIWKTITLILKTKNSSQNAWEVALNQALHSILSLLSTATNATPREKFFSFERRSGEGIALPTWLTTCGTIDFDFNTIGINFWSWGLILELYSKCIIVLFISWILEFKMLNFIAISLRKNSMYKNVYFVSYWWKCGYQNLWGNRYVCKWHLHVWNDRWKGSVSRFGKELNRWRNWERNGMVKELGKKWNLYFMLWQANINKIWIIPFDMFLMIIFFLCNINLNSTHHFLSS